jgi:hypothetical protein
MLPGGNIAGKPTAITVTREGIAPLRQEIAEWREISRLKERRSL